MAEDLYRQVSESDHFCFLSYKKENKELLRQIVPYLDFDVWYDMAVPFSEGWEKSIVSHIRSSQVMVLFLSREVMQADGVPYVSYEYDVAERNHKDVLVVFLDDVSFGDVPDELAMWYLRMERRQCLMYDPNRTREEWIRMINEAVQQILKRQKRETASASVVQEMRMSIISNPPDGKALYLGEGDVHLSPDGRRICLYNLEQDMFEMHLTDDMSSVPFRFRQDKAHLRISRIFYTPQRDYLYYICGGSIYICNMTTGKWRSQKGTKIRLEKGEELTRQLGTSGTCIYLLTEKNGYVYRIIHYDVAADSVEKYWDVSKCRLKQSLMGLEGRGGTLMLFTGMDDSLQALDAATGRFVPPSQEVLQPYMADARYHLTDVNDQLSHDGLLYTAWTGSNVRVLDAQTRALITDEYAETLFNLYLLKDRRVLKFDGSHQVMLLSPEGRKRLFDAAYFKSEAAFEGQMPMQMLYDELSGMFIFAVRVLRRDHHCCKLVVVNEAGRVVRISSAMYVPEADYTCKISIVQGELTVFLHTGAKRLADLQNTYIYRCEYR